MQKAGFLTTRLIYEYINDTEGGIILRFYTKKMFVPPSFIGECFSLHFDMIEVFCLNLIIQLMVIYRLLHLHLREKYNNTFYHNSNISRMRPSNDLTSADPCLCHLTHV